MNDEAASNGFDVKAFLKTLTKRPGIYKMLDAKGEIIYIGKAKSIKDRVLGHYRNAANDAKEAKLAEQAADIEYILTESE
ncbi:MAG: GIY-YIG nuclease family protein, partial [Methylomonas sp.]